MKFFSYLDKLIEENRILKFVVLILTLTNVALAVLFLQIRNTQKVVVVPPEIRREFWVSGNTLSKSYLEQVFYYITSSLLNVSPETVDDSISRVYVFLTTDPALVGRIKKAFQDYTSAIKRKKVYQVFYPMSMDIKSNVVIVRGMVKKIVGAGEVIEENKEVKYRFKVLNSRLFIEGIEL